MTTNTLAKSPFLLLSHQSSDKTKTKKAGGGGERWEMEGKRDYWFLISTISFLLLLLFCLVFFLVYS